MDDPHYQNRLLETSQKSRDAAGLLCPVPVFWAERTPGQQASNTPRRDSSPRPTPLRHAFTRRREDEDELPSTPARSVEPPPSRDRPITLSPKDSLIQGSLNEDVPSQTAAKLVEVPSTKHHYTLLDGGAEASYYQRSAANRLAVAGQVNGTRDPASTTLCPQDPDRYKGM